MSAKPLLLSEAVASTGRMLGKSDDPGTQGPCPDRALRRSEARRSCLVCVRLGREMERGDMEDQGGACGWGADERVAGLRRSSAVRAPTTQTRTEGEVVEGVGVRRAPTTM